MISRALVTLGEIADLQWGDTSVTKKSYALTGDRYPAYSASGQDGYLPYFDYDRIGVVLSAIGANAGKTWLATGRWSCIKNTIRFFSIDESVADTRYLFWATQAQGTFPLRGSAQPFISQGDARKVTIHLPPIEEQRAIAATLGALDDKIESNRRKAALIWDLASSKWQALLATGSKAPLGSILHLAYGKALPVRTRVPGTVPVYGSSGVTGWHNEALTSGPAVIIGRKGTVGSVHWEGADSFPIDTTFIVEPIHDWPLIACYFAAQGARLSEMNSDSAVPGLNRDRALSAEVQLPKLVDAQSWSQEVMPLIELASSASSESESLAQLRDSLLPELLSGRLSAALETRE